MKISGSEGLFDLALLLERAYDLRKLVLSHTGPITSLEAGRARCQLEKVELGGID